MDLRSRKYYFAALLSSMTLAVYLTALQNDFVNWDDDLYVYNNQNIRSLGWPFLRWAFTSFHAGNWHPLTWVSHALDYAVWGFNPLGHHLTSVVLHALNTGLVVLLVLRLAGLWRERAAAAGTPSFPDEQGVLIAAGTTGLLFGLHPLHVESVAWVAERKDVLCAFFFLLSIMAYARSAGAPEEGRGGWTARFLRRGHLSSLALFVLALMSKPMAVSLPFVLLLLDWFPFQRIRSWRTFRDACIEKLPFLVLTFASVIVTMMAQRDAMWTVAPPLPIRFLVAVRALTAYIGKMVVPSNLLPLYPYARDPAFYASIEYGMALLLVIVGSFFVLRNIKKGRFWPAVWCYYFVTLLPVLGIVQVGSQSMADRYTYLPSLGPFIAGGVASAWGWAKTAPLRKRRPAVNRLALGTAVLLVLVLSGLTMKQISLWKNSLVLWNHVIEKEPEHVPGAYYNRGLAFKESGQPERALEDLTEAITLRPSYTDAFMARGKMYKERGLIFRAIEDYNAAITLKPTLYSAYINRAQALKELGWYSESLEDYSTAIALNPFTPAAYMDRGRAFIEAGQQVRALDDFTTALDLDPDLIRAYVERGNLYRSMGDNGRAAVDYQNACKRGSLSGCEALDSVQERQRTPGR